MDREELKKHVKYEMIENRIFDKLRVGISAEISFTAIQYFVSDYGSDMDPDQVIMIGDGEGKTLRERFEDNMLDAMILRMKDDLKDL